MRYGISYTPRPPQTIPKPGGVPSIGSGNDELREDGGYELREDGGIEQRE